MAAGKIHLDELQHRRPEILNWYATSPDAGPVDGALNVSNDRVVHRYVRESPFFDHTSKNGGLFQQAQFNMELFNLVENRKALEDFLRKRQGLEFMIVGEPQSIKPGEPDTFGSGKNGIWVVRKQDRQSRKDREGREVRDADGQLLLDHLETRGTYYMVADAMYQAPSLGDVVQNRLMSATTALSQFFDTASQLPTFTPASGYTYLPQQSTKPPPVGSSAPTPSHSRQGSMVPGMDTQELQSGSLAREAPQDVPATTKSSNPQDTRLFVQALELMARYGDEYTDENPLLGEPGNFSFQHSTAAVQKRRADARAAEEKAREQAAKKAAATANPFANASKSSGKDDRAPSTAAEKLAKGDKEARRASRMDAKKRKKSRAVNAQTPGTPRVGTPRTPASGV